MNKDRNIINIFVDCGQLIPEYISNIIHSIQFIMNSINGLVHILYAWATKAH